MKRHLPAWQAAQAEYLGRVMTAPILRFHRTYLLALLAVAGCGEIHVTAKPVAGDPCAGDAGCVDALPMSMPDAVADTSDACDGGPVGADGGCIDTQTDNKNCGVVGVACTETQVCSAGRCVPICTEGAALCDVTCVDLQNDAQNCGRCGNACGANEECAAGTCRAACRLSLREAQDDDWKIKWDRTERAPDTQPVAEATCAQFGGRLPTISELYRVGATQAAGVGQTIHTNFIWAANPRGPNSRSAVRLSDSALTDGPATIKRPFRCVCPPPAPPSFTGNACYGPPNAACFAVDNEHNADIQDRPAQTVGSAIWECTQARAHLPDSRTMVEAIFAELPNGQFPTWVHTTDSVSPSANVVLRWTGKQPVWNLSDRLSIGNFNELRPFRCIGAKSRTNPYPATIANEFVGARSNLKSETMDSPAAPWVQAQATCFARGGHLATPAALSELIMQGLPGGSSKWLWTADSTGYSNPQFLTSVIAWAGVALDFPHFLTNAVSGITWAYKSEPMKEFRCVYYPINAAYKEPAPSDCAGGCFKVAAPQGLGVMWFDSSDRAPASWENAIALCRKRGASLATERDLTEAIRAGLPNGSMQLLQTSDLGYGGGGSAGLRAAAVKWNMMEPAFADQYPANMTWLDLGPTPQPFRCVWTNELR
ncbi:MAG: hypothetical protein SF187_00990 [Deltaproteobacteria bacterium]|nr:hypothetical protein [Deltaproteobacteria bacterium]